MNAMRGDRDTRGFSLVELLIALTILAVGILATAALFPTGYTTVSVSGDATMANAAVQQILEDLRSVDFVNLPVFNGLNTGGPTAAPAGVPDAGTNAIENRIARKWGYALDGRLGTWALDATEQSIWVPLTSGVTTPGANPGPGVPLGARGTITVTNVNTPPTLRQVNVTVILPNGQQIQGSSLYANMVP